MKVAAFTCAQGRVHIVRPCPWARLVTSIKIGDEAAVFDPPKKLEEVTSVRNQAAYDLLLSAAEVTFAETEEEFLMRICDERVPIEPTITVSGCYRIVPKVPRTVRKILPEGAEFYIMDATPEMEDHDIRPAMKIVEGKCVVDEAIVERDGLRRKAEPAQVVRT